MVVIASRHRCAGKALSTGAEPGNSGTNPCMFYSAPLTPRYGEVESAFCGRTI